MYIDLIVFFVLLALVFIFFKKFDCYVYFIAIFDMILRILTFVKYNIGLPDVAALIGKYIPENIPAIVGRYLNGYLYLIVVWIYVAFMTIFLFYTIRIFWKKKRQTLMK